MELKWENERRSRKRNLKPKIGDSVNGERRKSNKKANENSSRNLKKEKEEKGRLTC